MEFIQNYVPTSKAQLLQVAMWYHNGDIKKAQEMVDYYTKNMELPDFDPVRPTLIQQVKDNVGGLYSWVKENQVDLVNGWQMIRGLLKGENVADATVAVAGEALPEIN